MKKDDSVYTHLLDQAVKGLKLFIIGLCILCFGLGALLGTMFFALAG